MINSSAVYYPHTTIRNGSLLANALLMWDRLECIVPPLGLRTHHFEDEVYNEAVELLVRNHVPTPQEQARVHDTLSSMLENGIPDWFQLEYAPIDRDLQQGNHYRIYPDKLAIQTWQLLERRGLTFWDGALRDYGVSQALGLFLMSLLADARAGTQREKITDRTTAYAWLSQYATATLGGEYVRDFDAIQKVEAYDRLVPVSLRVIDTDKIPLRRLMDFRRRELTEGRGSDYRTLRHNYVKHLNEYASLLARPNNTDGDREEIVRRYWLDLEAKLVDLKTELGIARNEAILNKDIVTTLTFAAGIPFVPMTDLPALTLSAGLVGVGALTGLNKYRAGRRAAARNKDNPTSWLYLVTSQLPPGMRW